MPIDPGRSMDGPLDPTASGAETITAPFHTLAAANRENRYRAERLEAGARIGHYQVLSLLGEGGFSAVYAARHLYLNHEFALKTLRQGGTSREGSERFLREAQALALLTHPHVIRVIDAGMWEDMPYIVLEKIDGDNLQQLVARRGAFSVGRTLDLLEELGRVLVLQESVGILHRDIKPGNVLQRSAGSFCLLDYGLVGRGGGGNGVAQEAKDAWSSVTSSSIVGTPAYMAPEQIEGRRLDHRTDLYLLGMTAWECLAGRSPRTLEGDSSIGAIYAAAKQPVPPARSQREDVPTELDAILAGLLAPSAEERYPSAADFLDDLERFRYQGKPPIGGTRGDVFVAMPYAQRFDCVYQAIERSCREVRLRPRRMDQLVFVKDIWNQIVQEIEACTVVVADFSSADDDSHPNPNVLTEAAHARAIGKPLIIVNRDPAEQLPFDWRHMPVVRYAPDAPGLEALAEHLSAKLRHAILRAAH